MNGMLGGYERLSPLDAIGSLKFLDEFRSGPLPRLHFGRVLGACAAGKVFKSAQCAAHGTCFPRGRCAPPWTDCGAGIGRVSREVLLKVFQTGDLVEYNPLFVAQAKRCAYTGANVDEVPF